MLKTLKFLFAFFSFLSPVFAGYEGSVDDALLARDEIRSLAMRYSRYMSSTDFEQQASLFVEDGEVFLHGGSIPEAVGHKALAEMFSKGSKQLQGNLIPLLHNHEIELVSENSARGSIFVEVRSLGGDMRVISTGTYYDDYMKVNGEWKFKRRTIKIYAGFDVE